VAFTQYPASVILVTSASGSDFFEDFSDDEGEPEEEEDEEAVEDAEEEETEDTDEAGGLAIAGAASPSKGELKYKIITYYLAIRYVYVELLNAGSDRNPEQITTLL
jgi:hypothetical protein